MQEAMTPSNEVVMSYKLGRIAELLPAFRRPCQTCGGMILSFPIKETVCTPCNSTGYIPREVSLLAETLWKAGWAVHLRWIAKTPSIHAEVWNVNPKRHGYVVDATSADEALVEATLKALEAKP